MIIGERIAYLRKQKGLTVNRLANLSGVSQSYLRDIELGNKQPTVEYLSYICEGLGISLKHFFTNEEENNEILSTIDRLNEKQQKALLNFLKTLTDEK